MNEIEKNIVLEKKLEPEIFVRKKYLSMVKQDK